MAASFEESVYNIGIVTNDLEEDLEKDGNLVVNGEYDSVGAGGSDNEDNITEVNQVHPKHIPFSPAVIQVVDSQIINSFLFSQYRLSLQKSVVQSPFYILYCCAKDALH